MKIIDKRKDYYDYLTGIYGIDELVIFNRKNYSILENIDIVNIFALRVGRIVTICQSEFLLNGKLMSYDEVVKEANSDYHHIPSSFVKSSNLILKPKTLLRLETRIEKKLEPIELYIFPDLTNVNGNIFFNTWQEIFTNRSDLIKVLEDECSNRRDRHVLLSPHLSNIMTAEEVYREISSHILSQNELVNSQPLTDIQKLENHGFDKIISFRGNNKIKKK